MQYASGKAVLLQASQSLRLDPFSTPPPTACILPCSRSASHGTRVHLTGIPLADQTQHVRRCAGATTFVASVRHMNIVFAKKKCARVGYPLATVERSQALEIAHHLTRPGTRVTDGAGGRAKNASAFKSLR